MQRITPSEAQLQQHLDGRFHQTQSVSGDQRTSSMIRGFILTMDGDRHTTQRARDLACNCSGTSIAFDRKYDFPQLRHATSAKRLHRMKRTRGSASASKRRENCAVQRAAGVQNNFIAKFRFVKTSKLA